MKDIVMNLCVLVIVESTAVSPAWYLGSIPMLARNIGTRRFFFCFTFFILLACFGLCFTHLNLLVVTLSKAMMDVVLLTDRDESFEFSDKEINRLILRMKNLPAIKINEDKLRAQVEKERSFYSVIGLLQDINDETIAEEDHIFVVNEEEYEPQESE